MSDDDVSASTKGRKQRFTIQERKLLVKLVIKRHKIVHNNKLDSKSQNEKNQAWQDIYEEFVKSDIVKQSRSPHQLKRCWENMRSKAKAGDLVSQRLVKWADKQHKYYMDNGGDFSRTCLDDKFSSEDSNSSGDLKDEEDESMETNSSERLAAGSDDCSCDKMERAARMKVLRLEKKCVELKIQHEKEQHKLMVHQLSLKVENERRKAEILDRELALHVT